MHQPNDLLLHESICLEDHHLQQVLGHEREDNVDAVEDHVRRRHRPTGGRRSLVLVTKHLV